MTVLFHEAFENKKGIESCLYANSAIANTTIFRKLMYHICGKVTVSLNLS